MEFVLGRFSHFYIAIAYSSSTFCGTWTPSFCEFTLKLSKFQQNEHIPGLLNSFKIFKQLTQLQAFLLIDGKNNG